MEKWPQSNAMEIPEERKLFFTSLIITVLFLGMFFFLRAVHVPIPPCYFRRLTGLYCPGCGGTRAWAALIHGQVFRSLVYHPVVPYAAAVYVAYVTRNLLALILKIHPVRALPARMRRHLQSGMVFRGSYLYLAVAIILVNWIVKNILLCMFHLAM